MNNTNRDLKIVSRFLNGETHEELSQAYGISRERVRTILLSHGVTGKDGGAKVRSERKKIKQQQGQTKHYFNRYGATKAEIDKIRSKYGQKPFTVFQMKRQNAKPAVWNLTFKQWWDLWKTKWHKRGARLGCYCMSRIDRSKPYEVGNVRIILFDKLRR